WGTKLAGLIPCKEDDAPRLFCIPFEHVPPCKAAPDPLFRPLRIFRRPTAIFFRPVPSSRSHWPRKNNSAGSNISLDQSYIGPALPTSHPFGLTRWHRNISLENVVVTPQLRLQVETILRLAHGPTA